MKEQKNLSRPALFAGKQANRSPPVLTLLTNPAGFSVDFLARLRKPFHRVTPPDSAMMTGFARVGQAAHRLGASYAGGCRVGIQTCCSSNPLGNSDHCPRNYADEDIRSPKCCYSRQYSNLLLRRAASAIWVKKQSSRTRIENKQIVGIFGA